MPPPTGKAAIFSLRSLVLLTISTGIGVAAAALRYLSVKDIPECIALGVATLGAALVLLDKVVEKT